MNANINLAISESIATELSDKKKVPIYNSWSRSLNIGEDRLSTEVLILGMPSTQPSYDCVKFWAVANEWQKIAQPLFGNQGVSLQYSSTKPRRVTLPYFPDLIDYDVIAFCVENNIFNALQDYYQCVLESFKNIKTIEVTLDKDYEIKDALKVRFSISVQSSDIDRVLADEERFNLCALEMIKRELLPKFVSTIQLT